MTRANMDLLLDDGIRTATHFLSKRGEFFPFAAAKTSDGEVRHIQAQMENDKPSPQEVLDVLLPRLTAEARSGFYVAAAIITNVDWTDTQTGEKSDAIRLDIEGEHSDPVTCFLPYKLHLGEITLGELRATKGVAIIFET